MTDKKRGGGLRRRLRAAYKEELSLGCRGELTGRRRLMIQGCESILDYDETCIRLCVRSGELEEMVICGKELLCQSYHPDAIVIVGEIGRIELWGEEDGHED